MKILLSFLILFALPFALWSQQNPRTKNKNNNQGKEAIDCIDPDTQEDEHWAVEEELR